MEIYTLLLTPMEGDDRFSCLPIPVFECASGNILEEQIDIFKSEFIKYMYSVKTKDVMKLRYCLYGKLTSLFNMNNAILLLSSSSVKIQ